jgi:cathepsin L
LTFFFSQDDTCRFQKRKAVADLSGCKDIPSESESALMEAIASEGPVSIAIDASHSSFQMYSGGGLHFDFFLFFFKFSPKLHVL